MTLPHYAEAARSVPGECWRYVSNPDGEIAAGQPRGCDEPVRWTGTHDFGGTRLPVWSCDEHRGGYRVASPHDGHAPWS